MNLLPLLLAVLARLALASECQKDLKTIKLPGKCPQITYITNLDPTVLVGTRYVVYAGNIETCPGGCVVDTVKAAQNATLTPNGYYSSQICCHQGAQVKCGAEYGSLDYEDDGGALREVPRKGFFPYYILDYSHDFIIYYGCSSSPCGPVKEDAFVEIKGPVLTDDLKNHIYRVLISNGVLASNIVEIPVAPNCPAPAPAPTT